MYRGVTSTLGLLLLSLAPCSAEDVCFEGYVMDLYCINRGTLFDNPSLSTLEHPINHTVHCLVDVPNCYNSGYELLAPEPNADGTYCRAYVLDEPGNEKVLVAARGAGNTAQGCSTCGTTGNQRAGFFATVQGTVDASDKNIPALLKVTSVVSGSAGCPSGVSTPKLQCEQGGDTPLQIAHGTCMLISWGIMLPSGVIIAHNLKHRPDAFWFVWHRRLQVTGITIAFIGWCIALASFNVFLKGGAKAPLAHGSMGMVVMILGLLQPVNAYFRPHPSKPSDDDAMKRKRRCWEILHKGSGYTAVILALGTIAIGVTIPGIMAFPIIYALILVYLFGFLIYSVREYKKAHKMAPWN